MYTTPSKRGGAAALFASRSGASPTVNHTRVQALTKGLFSDGVWHCNCTPRLPATHFEVKKEGRNKGRWFYTCQTNKEDGGCGFFLWGEDAKAREGKAVISGLRSEREGLESAARDGGGRDRYGVREARTTPTKSSRSSRGDETLHGSTGDVNDTATLQAQASEESNSGEFGSWPLSPGTEARVLEVSDVGIKYSSPPWPESEPPSTPRRSIRSNEFTTPSSKRKRDGVRSEDEAEEDGNRNGKAAIDSLPTPVTGGGRMRNASEYNYNDSDPFSTPSSLRTPSTGLFGIRSPSHTPQPSHMRQPSHFTLKEEPSYPQLQETLSYPTLLHHVSPFDPPQPSNPYDITPDILSLLQEEGIVLPSSTQERLRALLGKHAMRVNGVAKGRDITRVALKSKDVKIAELNQRIGQFEAEREVDKRVIASLRERRGS